LRELDGLNAAAFGSTTGGSACDAIRYRLTSFELNDWSIEMDTEKAEGTVREVAGKVQGAAGALVGDSATQLAGKARELSGKAQQLCADYVSMVRETAVTKPLTALAVVAAVSFVAGVIWRAGGSTREDR
jgi:uncharacterized protein YjbJ (UPF0337 family)